MPWAARRHHTHHAGRSSLRRSQAGSSVSVPDLRGLGHQQNCHSGDDRIGWKQTKSPDCRSLKPWHRTSLQRIASSATTGARAAILLEASDAALGMQIPLVPVSVSRTTLAPGRTSVRSARCVLRNVPELTGREGKAHAAIDHTKPLPIREGRIDTLMLCWPHSAADPGNRLASIGVPKVTYRRGERDLQHLRKKETR